jgi:hypothetical protein
VALSFDFCVWHVLFSVLLFMRFRYVSLVYIILYIELDVKLILTTDFTDIRHEDTKARRNQTRIDTD